MVDGGDAAGLAEAGQLDCGGAQAGSSVRLRYRNWRGEISVRTITPQNVWHGKTDWHPEPQWLVSAWDHDKQAMRDFALADFLGRPD